MRSDACVDHHIRDLAPLSSNHSVTSPGQAEQSLVNAIARNTRNVCSQEVVLSAVVLGASSILEL